MTDDASADGPQPKCTDAPGSQDAPERVQEPRRATNDPGSVHLFPETPHGQKKALHDDFSLAPPPAPDHARWPIWRTMTEAEWQAQVIRMATQFGFRWYHPWTGLHSPFGYPDLTLVRANDPERGWTAAIIWLELKREGQRPTNAQSAWLREIRSAGCPAFVIYPHDEDALEDLLT